MTSREGTGGDVSHRTTVVFTDAVFRDIQAMKGDESASRYICDAVLMRIYFERGMSLDRALEKARKRGTK